MADEDLLIFSSAASLVSHQQPRSHQPFAGRPLPQDWGAGDFFEQSPNFFSNTN
jgi:hypothetical protein